MVILFPKWKVARRAVSMADRRIRSTRRAARAGSGARFSLPRFPSVFRSLRGRPLLRSLARSCRSRAEFRIGRN